MTRYAIILLAPILTGCNGLEILSGGESPSKIAYEQRQALITPIAETTAVSDIAPVIISEPTCTPVFRVTKCDGNNPIPWSM